MILSAFSKADNRTVLIYQSEFYGIVLMHGKSLGRLIQQPSAYPSAAYAFASCTAYFRTLPPFYQHYRHVVGTVYVPASVDKAYFSHLFKLTAAAFVYMPCSAKML